MINMTFSGQQGPKSRIIKEICPTSSANCQYGQCISFLHCISTSNASRSCAELSNSSQMENNMPLVLKLFFKEELDQIRILCGCRFLHASCHLHAFWVVIHLQHCHIGPQLCQQDVSFGKSVKNKGWGWNIRVGVKKLGLELARFGRG